MPKVKARKPAKAGKRKSAPTRSLADLAERYALAAVAGAAVIAISAGAVLWAGGYVGVVAENVETAMREAAVGAGFGVKRVTLMGRRNAAPDDVAAALGPVVGDSLLHFDPHAARRRVEALGWVRNAAVSRLYPGTVHVSIREREPAAVWQLSGALHLIDADGAVIREIGAYEYPELPLIVGAGAPDAAAGLLNALIARPEIASLTAALVRVGERRWNMRLKNGLDVKLPETGYDDALAMLAAMQDANGLLDQSLEYIDLRNPDRMDARPRTQPADERAK